MPGYRIELQFYENYPSFTFTNALVAYATPPSSSALMSHAPVSLISVHDFSGGSNSVKSGNQLKYSLPLKLIGI